MLNQETFDNLHHYKKHYQENGWVRISNFLVEDYAEQLAAAVAEVANDPQVWRIATLVQGKAFVARVNDYLAQEPNVRSHFIAEILRYAQLNDFQYFYEFIRLLGEDSSAPGVLDAISRDWESESLLQTLRTVVDNDDIAQIDAQLTRYKPGHFLKHHSDEGYQSAQQRKVAYVMSLSKDWQPDWGGLLHFQNADGKIIESLTPEFNSLTLFKVPTAHFVSQVTNYCPASRYSMTGWLWANRN